MIGRNDNDEVIEELWLGIKHRLWLCFDALRNHKNRFRSIGDDKCQKLHERLLVHLNDHDAHEAFDAEVEKCYNNRFNTARAFYYKLQQNIVS